MKTVNIADKIEFIELPENTFINGEINPVIFIFNDLIEEVDLGKKSKDKLYLVNENDSISILSYKHNAKIKVYKDHVQRVKYSFCPCEFWDHKKGLIYGIDMNLDNSGINLPEFTIARIYITSDFKYARIGSSYEFGMIKLKPNTTLINRLSNITLKFNYKIFIILPILTFIYTLFRLIYQ